MNTIYVQSVDDEEKWSPTVYKPRFKWLTRCLVTCKRSTDTTNYFIDEKKKTMVIIFFFWMHLLSSWHQTERFRPKCGHKYHNTCTPSHTIYSLAKLTLAKSLQISFRLKTHDHTKDTPWKVMFIQICIEI